MPAYKNGDRSNKAAVENDLIAALKFDERGLIPVVTTDVASGDVLMQAYMNDQAVARTIETGEAHYFSRSRQELWHKGATSGEVQIVKDFRTDCDQDALWLVVEQLGGGCCHVGYESCFYRAIDMNQTVSQEEPIGLRHVGHKKA